MGQSQRNPAAETNVPKIHSINVFYKCGTGGTADGFSVTIADNADHIDACLKSDYQQFKALKPCVQQAILNGFPMVLARTRAILADKVGTHIEGGDQQAVLQGVRAVYVLEKEHLLPDDRFNGFEYRTMAEVNAFKQVLESLNQGKKGVFLFNYKHDNDCPKLRGGECSCQAEVAVQTA
jgi:hypothetical protein